MVEAVHGDTKLFNLNLPAFCGKHDPFKVLDRVLKLRAEGQHPSYAGVMRTAMQNFMRAA